MKIMLIEDDYLLSRAIESYLNKYDISSFLDGRSALNSLDNMYDVFIIDIDIPEINGIELLTEIKYRYKDSYTIMISATTEIDTIEEAYTIGCNDYMKKPFNVKELKLKLENLNKKFSNEISLSTDLKLIKNLSKLVYKENKNIDLTLNELNLLNLLIKNRGKIVNYQTIINSIWEYENESNQVRQLVNRLKRKMPEDIIKNRRNQGYIIK
ncbi:MAG: DNA-binding response regulator [Arcobacter sp.]|uniref:Response regulator n=2 Tax=Poseidonibacter ostreae TaxID=2654171 RepID=A0ABQ6VK28_9BACT|nr:response regulator [Poseidonibacter ostreae]KAB7890073.1 response regulator [Poseidonibacter ostreae]MAC83929.1 DNA-binding response regulator [Arcobacter sp.]